MFSTQKTATEVIHNNQSVDDYHKTDISNITIPGQSSVNAATLAQHKTIPGCGSSVANAGTLAPTFENCSRSKTSILSFSPSLSSYFPYFFALPPLSSISLPFHLPSIPFPCLPILPSFPTVHPLNPARERRKPPSGSGCNTAAK